MVEIDKVIGGSGLGIEKNKNLHPTTCNLILQVHDELLFECNPEDVEKTAKIIKEKMEDAIKLSIPVKVDLKSGPNWGEMSLLSS